MSAATGRVCVIGAGLGGLALAIRLQAAGLATTLVEARDEVGGRAATIRREHCAFHASPLALDDPAGLRELWSIGGGETGPGAGPGADLVGQAPAGLPELWPIRPYWRLNWPDGALFEHAEDEARLRGEVARLAPADLAGYEDFAEYAGAVLAETRGRDGAAPPSRLTLDLLRDDLPAALRSLPPLARYQGWRSLHGKLRSWIESPRLRQALSFRAVLDGADPRRVSALAARAHAAERQHGLWWPRGGTGALGEAMAARFQALGGELRLADPVKRIHTLGNRVSAVESASGWHERFDAVASTADPLHTWRDLLAGNPRAQAMIESLARARWSPGLFSVHLALAGSWPGLVHNTMLFGQRWRGWLTDLFDHGVLPLDLTMAVRHASATDPSLAPAGTSVIDVLVPVPNRARLPIDWREVGPQLEERVIDQLARRLIPDIRDRISIRFHRSPRDLAADFGAHLGSAWGPRAEAGLGSLGQPRFRDAVIGNLYLLGCSTGPGLAGLLAGARAAADDVIRNHAER